MGGFRKCVNSFGVGLFGTFMIVCERFGSICLNNSFYNQFSLYEGVGPGGNFHRKNKSLLVGTKISGERHKPLHMTLINTPGIRWEPFFPR